MLGRRFSATSSPPQRLGEARRDVEHGLQLTLARFGTRAQQQRALDVLQFKLDILWTMLDAMWMAYVEKKPPFSGCPDSPRNPGS